MASNKPKIWIKCSGFYCSPLSFQENINNCITVRVIWKKNHYQRELLGFVSFSSLIKTGADLEALL